MENSNQFYKELPILDSFFQVSNLASYHSLPEDWYVAVSDILNSTKAIYNDQYKRVNILGASPIIGMLNIADRNAVPYIFSGDGCSLCIPPDLLDAAYNVFGASRQIGKTEYGLDLRSAIFPVSYLRNLGHDVKVARFQVSDVYSQALFWGGGLEAAEDILKTPDYNDYQVPVLKDAAGVDFSGLECRWKKVGQPGKQVITMLVKCNPEIERPEMIYDKVLQEMRDIFGFDDHTNPISASELTMNVSLPALMGETKFRTFGMNALQRFRYLLKIEIEILLGKLFMFFGYKSSATDWARYKPDLALNSDHRKFDDMLRVVIGSTKDQYRQLEQFLQKMFEKSFLAYGTHVTDTAMVTCMVFKYHRQHIHFVDGSEGGYVKASKELKRRMDQL